MAESHPAVFLLPHSEAEQTFAVARGSAIGWYAGIESSLVSFFTHEMREKRHEGRFDPCIPSNSRAPRNGERLLGFTVGEKKNGWMRLSHKLFLSKSILAMREPSDMSNVS